MYAGQAAAHQEAGGAVFGAGHERRNCDADAARDLKLCDREQCSSNMKQWPLVQIVNLNPDMQAKMRLSAGHMLVRQCRRHG